MPDRPRRADSKSARNGRADSESPLREMESPPPPAQKSRKQCDHTSPKRKRRGRQGTGSQTQALTPQACLRFFHDARKKYGTRRLDRTDAPARIMPIGRQPSRRTFHDRRQAQRALLRCDCVISARTKPNARSNGEARNRLRDAATPPGWRGLGQTATGGVVPEYRDLTPG
jgi:hypothetical protein